MSTRFIIACLHTFGWFHGENGDLWIEPWGSRKLVQQKIGPLKVTDQLVYARGKDQDYIAGLP
jgi:hypothetical protein